MTGLADVATTDDDRMQLTFALARLFFGLGRIAEAEELVDKAETAVIAPVHSDALATIRARFAYRDGRPGAALDIASEVLARPSVDRLAMARAAATRLPRWPWPDVPGPPSICWISTRPRRSSSWPMTR